MASKGCNDHIQTSVSQTIIYLVGTRSFISFSILLVSNLVCSVSHILRLLCSLLPSHSVPFSFSMSTIDLDSFGKQLPAGAGPAVAAAAAARNYVVKPRLGEPLHLLLCKMRVYLLSIASHLPSSNFP